MREYNFDFKGKKFDATIVKKRDGYMTDKLYIGDKIVYSYFRVPKDKTYLLKIVYPKEKYEEDENLIEYRIVFIYILIVFILVLISLFYTVYALKPMKKALILIEEFLKDVIHDINTPITTILLNVSYLKSVAPSDELDRVEISAQRILSLYKNFEMQIKGFHPDMRDVDIYKLINERVEYFKKLYPSIDINIKGDKISHKTDKDAFLRIIDNILSNACKYAQPKNPKVNIDISKHHITISDNGMGIERVDKVFDRFYKESERGIGIGMSIVKRLCDELDIKISVKSKINKGTTIELTLN